MKLKSMRSILPLLLICVVIIGTATAVGDSVAEKMTAACTDDPFPGHPGQSAIAIVYVSGHGNTYIDGLTLTPDETGQVGGYDANWYAATPGTHSIFITGTGYINFISEIPACTGKVSYVYYDQESHRALGTTPKETTITTVSTTTAVTNTPTVDGQSTDYGAIKGALGTKAPPGTYGSLSVSTDPGGATIYIDGVQLGISPATIPGLSAGTHTLLLKLDGYQDLSLPVVISAGTTHSYSSALLKSGAAPGVAGTPARKSSAPGFGAAIAACVAGFLFLTRKTRP